MQTFSKHCRPEECNSRAFSSLPCSDLATIWIEWISGDRRSFCKKHFDLYQDSWDSRYSHYRVLSENEVKMLIALT